MSDVAVEATDLAVRFGDHRVLDAVDFAVPAGAYLAIVGPNGSGKSTLVRTCLGLVEVERGAIRLHGRPSGEVPAKWIGYVPQVKTFDRSFPALAVELVSTGLHGRWPWRLGTADRRRALDALARVGVAHLADRPSGRLSGGELQRVYLARAVVRAPRIVLLDEPATGIDVAGEADMYRLLDDYRQETGATVVMVTHDLEAAHHATHVLLLNTRQIAFGRPEAVLTADALRRAFGHLGHAHAMHQALEPHG